MALMFSNSRSSDALRQVGSAEVNPADLRPAIFLDKDGTLVRDIPYNVDPERLEFYPDVFPGLQRLDAAGYSLIVITNQAGVARGYFPESALATLQVCFQQRFQDAGVALTGFYYCPHHPQGIVADYTLSCNCRKPQPGLLYRAAQQHGIDLSRSWLIGDILNDVEAGRAAGCRTILIHNGNETEWLLSPSRLPHHIVSCFAEAVPVILALAAIEFTSARNFGYGSSLL